MVIVRTFGDAIVSQELNKEAWKKLSREFNWNEELLRKYCGEIDWEALSCNYEMLWTASILENFKNYINWKELSGNAPEKLLTPKIIEKFADKWDWHELSDNSNLRLSYALLDKFADKWDWERIINRWRSEELYTPDFLERYKEFIPAEEFKSSYLWDALVERSFDELVEEIMG
jgi:hypothetical protein